MHGGPGQLHAQGRYQEALPFAEKAVRLGNQEFGPDHPTTATSLYNPALLDNAQGKYPEAEPLVKRALAVREKSLGPDHPGPSHERAWRTTPACYWEPIDSPKQ